VGTILEGLYGDQVGEIAVQLARHFQEAELPIKAIGYLQTAAQRASRSLAYVEAARHYSLALQLLATLPPTPERDQQELMLQIGLGQALVVAKGFGHVDVAQAFNRARELSEQVGDSSQRFTILLGLAAYYHVRAQHKSALALGEQMLEIAQHQSNTTYLVLAHMVLGLNLLFLGKLTSAPTHLEQMIARFDPRLRPEFLAGFVGVDPGAFGLGSLGYTLWFLGYPDQAIKRQDEAIVLARSLAHPYSLAFALGTGMSVHQLRGDSAAASTWAEENIALSTQQEMPLWIAPSLCLRGWALAVEGETAAGVAQMQQGLGMMDAMGTISLRPHYLAYLVAVLAQAGQHELCLPLVNVALSPDNKSDHLLYVAELYRLKGDLLLMQGNGADEVEACYRQAIDVARNQAAKSLELRATMSLCRLLQQQGRNGEGRQLLGELYGWFSEGFETQDLREAKALLTEIAGT
jgi:adenylate cyclase